MAILVIGASGFVGSNLLRRNLNFLGCDLHSSNPRVKKLDVQKTELLNMCCKIKVKQKSQALTNYG